MRELREWRVIFLIIGLLIAHLSFAACENRIGMWRVDYPRGSAQQTISFRLFAGPWEMYVDSRAADKVDPKIQDMENILYHAAYESGIVKFGVIPEVCNYIDDYFHYRGAPGGYSVLNLTQMINLERVKPQR